MDKNGVIITTAIRQEECTKAIEKLIQHTPEPYNIILMHAPGNKDLDQSWPEELAAEWQISYCKMQPGQAGGVTAAWNKGFKIALAQGCDTIVCMNDDVYVNNSWPNIFDTIRNEYPSGPTIVGPVSSNPGIDYTRVQKQTQPINKKWLFSKEQPAGSHNNMYYCLNGFCFGLRGSVCHDLIERYGNVLDEEKYPWGGQEEDLGRRIESMGGKLIVDGQTYVDHLKFSDWRRLRLYK